MKKLIYLFLIVAIAATSACKKEEKKKGCTDPQSKNYCSDCEESDGSCQFEGKLVFWWNEEFTDSCAANGINSIRIYVNNNDKGTVQVASLFFTANPGCGASNTITVTEDFGSSKSKTISTGYEGLDISGAVVTPLVNQNLSISTGCNNFQLTW